MSFIVRREPELPLLDGKPRVAVCVGAFATGTHYEEYTNNNGTKSSGEKEKIAFLFEVPSETALFNGEMSPRQFLFSCTFSLHEKSTLYKTLVSWLGRNLTKDELSGGGFDIRSMLGEGCQITLKIVDKKNGNGSYNKINTITALPDGVAAPKAKSPYMTYDVEEWDDAAYEALPYSVKREIQRSLQFRKDHPPTDVIDVKLPGKEENPI